jgi:uncharacterized protein (TIGR02996 family)
VTTEDDFQAMLDRDRFDATTCLVFADWLAERADPREAGYRALGLLKRAPVDPKRDGYGLPGWWTWEGSVGGNESITFAVLAPDWLATIPRDPGQTAGDFWRTFPSGRAARDAAALAFGKLPDARRAEILAEQPDPPEVLRSTRKKAARRRSTRKKAAPKSATPKSAAPKQTGRKKRS